MLGFPGIPGDHGGFAGNLWGVCVPLSGPAAKRFGLLSYGCCERVDAIWPEYLSKWKNLRKLSVSPFNNEAQVGEYLRGSRVVFYSKPRAEYVTNRGPLEEDAIRAYFKGWQSTPAAVCWKLPSGKWAPFTGSITGAAGMCSWPGRPWKRIGSLDRVQTGNHKKGSPID